MESTNDYMIQFSRRNGWTWALAGFWALTMNIVLFAAMPHLLNTNTSPAEFDQILDQINVIRVKRAETPVERKTVKPPEPQVRRINLNPKAVATSVVQPKMALPFEVNAKLPSSPSSLELPPMVSASLDSFATTVQDVFKTEDLDQPLVTLARIPPIYPLIAKRNNVEGWVEVNFLVDEHGRVHDPVVIKAEPPNIFDASVLRGVMSWRFKPGTVQGVPVKVRVETTVRFELK